MLLFDREEYAYRGIVCFEKIFKKHGTLESLKMLKADGALRGSALKCWICWSRVHRRYSWDRFTTNLLWRFKPEWREIFPYDEEEEPHQELQLLHTKDSISQTSTIPLYQLSALETLYFFYKQHTLLIHFHYFLMAPLHIQFHWVPN